MNIPMEFEVDAHVTVARGEHAALSGTLCVYFFNGTWMFRPDGVEPGGVGHLWVRQNDIAAPDPTSTNSGPKEED